MIFWQQAIGQFGGFALLSFVLWMIYKDNSKTIIKQFETIIDQFTSIHKLTEKSIEVNTKVIEVLADHKEYNKGQMKDMHEVMEGLTKELKHINYKVDRIDRNTNSNGTFQSAEN